MKNVDYIIPFLETIRNKGGCIYTIEKARQALREINARFLLTESESQSLSTALWHFEHHEGTTELYDLVDKLKTKYSK